MDLAFDGMTLNRLEGKTTIIAHVRDQIHLYSLLQRLAISR